MPRFAILEHTGAPDDAAGRHVDLLVETGGSCRTWRLLQVPVTGGDSVAAAEIAPHRLAWLDHVAGEVSGGRGFARRIVAGEYAVTASDAAHLTAATQVAVQLTGGVWATHIALTRATDHWLATARV